MHIELSTDNNIDGKERLAAHVNKLLTLKLARFADQITRVEVHLREETSKNAGSQGEKRCMMEARLEGRKPIAVTDTSAELNQAITGAAKKLANAVESMLGRLHDSH